MIIETAELSPTQKVALEELLGQPLREKGSINLLEIPAEKSAEQRVAAENLAKFLAARKRPRSGASNEELEAAILEALRSERPHYTQIA